MKDVSATYIANEEAEKRKPVEIYKIWLDSESEYWYYTSGDVAVTYDGNSYTPAQLKRSLVKYDSDLEVTSMTISASYLNDSVVDYLVQNPIEIVWISLMKLHRSDLTEADVIFIGQIKTVAFKGGDAQINCVGFEHFLKKTIPTWRYQLTCNHTVFDSGCGLTKATYKTTETITLSADGLTLTGTAFGTKADGYFIGGEVVFGYESRPIVYHVDTVIKIAYAFLELETSDSVDAYPGCDGRPETCKDTFSNIINRLGFETTPQENPGLRIDW
jgi:uncharacterized phage protein (TIGR02218 family)